MELQGKVKFIDEIKTFGTNGFKKREIVITTEEQYPQHISIEFIQDRCQLLDAFQEEDMVKIGINIKGREWVNPQGERKYFNSIQGWRIEKLDAQQASGKAVPVPPLDTFEPAEKSKEEDYDDLPF